MDREVKVSVIVPVYNVENYLARCLNSLINQTLHEIEIICINDGSSDNSLNILEEYSNKDARIRVVNQENKGLSKSRNTGIDLATGEYISFVDSDDWVDENFLEVLYNAAKEHDADIAATDVAVVRSTAVKDYIRFENVAIYTDTIQKYNICKCPEKCNIWNKIYKLDKIRQHQLYFENIYYEDVVWTPKVLYYLNTLITIPGTKYYYFRHGQSVIRKTKKNKKMQADLAYAHEVFDKFLADVNIDKNLLEIKQVKKYKLLGITLLKKITIGQKEEYKLFNIIKWRKS